MLAPRPIRDLPHEAGWCFNAGGSLSGSPCSAAYSLNWPAPSTWRTSSTCQTTIPNRMIAASIALYVGLGIIIAITIWSHWKGTRL
jgi:hypothetical protein